MSPDQYALVCLAGVAVFTVGYTALWLRFWRHWFRGD